MARKWKNGGSKDPDGARLACGCHGTRDHRCLEEDRPKKAPQGYDVAAWIKREMERLEGPARAAFLVDLGALGRRLS